MKAPIALALCAALVAGPASADIDRVSVLVGSNHVGATGDWNETNPGVFLTWDDAIGSLDVNVGIYKNSFYETSFAVTATYEFIEWQDGAIGAFAGAAYYGKYADISLYNHDGWIPLAGLQARHGNAFIQASPMQNKAFVVSFGFTFEVE